MVSVWVPKALLVKKNKLEVTETNLLTISTQCHVKPLAFVTLELS